MENNDVQGDEKDFGYWDYLHKTLMGSQVLDMRCELMALKDLCVRKKLFTNKEYHAILKKFKAAIYSQVRKNG